MVGATRIIGSVVTMLSVAVAAVMLDPPPGRPLGTPAVAATSTDHWVAFLHQTSAPTSLELHITAATPTAGTVSGAPLGADVEGAQSKALRVTSNAPITVRGVTRSAGGVSAFAALPHT